MPAAQSFSRLYMIPGLYHCPCGQPVDGDPATTVQLMPQLVAWVEHGQAPGSITLPVTAQTTGAHAGLAEHRAFRSAQAGAEQQWTQQQLPLHRRDKRLQARRRAMVRRSGPPLICSRR